MRGGLSSRLQLCRQWPAPLVTNAILYAIGNDSLTMKFTQETTDGALTFGDYGNGQLKVNGQTHNTGLIIFPDHLHQPWPVTSVESLTIDQLQPLLDRKPDVALLGSGATQQFPSTRLRRELAQLGLQLDVMDTGAACRTYNLLVSEGRHVGAAIICF